MPPPPPEYWAAREEDERQRQAWAEEEEGERGKGQGTKEEPAPRREPDPVLRDHRAKFEKPAEGTPWDEPHALATEPKRGRPGLRYADGGEQWPRWRGEGSGR
ncbi:MAG: hypothetical protein R2748_33915, partial [Bryobacterales bacterium]